MLNNAKDAGLGHNNPPSDIEVLHQKLKFDNAERLKRKAELLAGIDRVPEITDHGTADKATDFIKQIKAVAKDAEEARKASKKPFDEAGKAVQSFFKTELIDPLTSGAGNVQRKLNVFLAEQDRIRRENEEKEHQRREEAQRAAEAEAKRLEEAGQAFAAEEAAKKVEQFKEEAEKAERQAAKNTGVKTGAGTSASLRKVWSFDIEDLAEMDLNQLKGHFNMADIEKAIRSYIREDGRELKGVRIFQTTSTTVR